MTKKYKDAVNKIKSGMKKIWKTEKFKNKVKKGKK